MSIGFTDRTGLPPQTVIADRRRMVTLVCTLVRSTAKGVLVRDDAGTEAWLPRVSIQIEDGISRLRITLPAWLALEAKLSAVPTDDQKTLF
jgi:hypothetical protein